MKKFKILIFVLVLLLAGVASASTNYLSEIPRIKGNYVFVSWNIANFGRSKSPEELRFIAKILRNADIVAIQEVSTSEAGAKAAAKLSDELNRTGSKWDYVVSDSTHESHSKERYVFLWKTSRVKAIPRRAVLIKSLEKSLEREPAKINFDVKGQNLTIVSFHLVPTKKKPEREARAVVNIFNEFSADNIILSGDFNLGHKKLNPIFEKKLKLKHQIESKTSLKNKLDKKGKYYSKAYDNIYTKGITVYRSAIVDFVPYFKNLKTAKQISDHLPVIILFTP